MHEGELEGAKLDVDNARRRMAKLIQGSENPEETQWLVGMEAECRQMIQEIRKFQQER